VDLVCLVVERYYRSLETVRRMAALVDELLVGRLVVVANKVRSPADAEAIGEFCARRGFVLAGMLPCLEEVVAADRDSPSRPRLAGCGAVRRGSARLGRAAAGAGMPRSVQCAPSDVTDTGEDSDPAAPPGGSRQEPS